MPGNPARLDEVTAMNTATKFSVYPEIGQVLNVLHQSSQDQYGNARLERAGREVRTIKQVHVIDSGLPTVTDNAGETWTVKPAKLNEWETCFPPSAE